MPLAGLAVMVACYWVFDARLSLIESGQVPLVVGHGMALGGVLAAAAIGGPRQRVAVAAGVAFGMATGMASIRLLTPQFRPGQELALYTTVPVATVAALAVIAAVWAAWLDAPFANRPRHRELLMPTFLAAVLYMVVLAGNMMRQAIAAVAPFSEYSAIALALLIGLILVWVGYRRGQAPLARWVLLCLALAGPAPASVLIYQYDRTYSRAAMVLAAATAAVAGALLARYARRDLPWEVIGIAVAACGMVLGSIGNRVIPGIGDPVTMLIGAGVAFALGSGLVALLIRVAHPATALSLGLVTLVLVAHSMRPATLLALQPSVSDHLPLSVPMVSLLAAGGIVALQVFSRQTQARLAND